jgi:TPR repeat protein
MITPEELIELKVKAENGDLSAQNRLGWMYQFGESVPRNAGEAAKWFLMAAEQGDPTAQNHLAWMYHDGEGVPRDHAEAYKWFTLASEHENKRIARHMTKEEIEEGKKRAAAFAKKRKTRGQTP